VCVAVFSPNDISGLRRPKNVKFGTKVASSRRMMRALRFLEKFLIVTKLAFLAYFWRFLQNAIFSINARWLHVYGCTMDTQKQRIHSATVRTDCLQATLDCGALRTI